MGGGVTSDFLLYPLFPTFSTVNIYYLYKPKQIPFFFFLTCLKKCLCVSWLVGDCRGCEMGLPQPLLLCG